MSGVNLRACVQLSMCNEPLIELSNPGASGSIFYMTGDDEFIIKTIQHKEAEFLQKLLPGYYMVRTYYTPFANRIGCCVIIVLSCLDGVRLFCL